MEMLSNLLTVTGQAATWFLMMAVGFVLAVLLYRKRDTEFRSGIYR